MGQLLTFSLRDRPQGYSPSPPAAEARLANEVHLEEDQHEVTRQGFSETVTYSSFEVLSTIQNMEETKKAAEQRRRKAEEMARTAAQRARGAVEARETFKRHMGEGLQLFATPSSEEFAAAKRRIQYQEGYFHFAVAGTAGSGKSSALNAFRGLRSRDACAAPVGIAERALQVARYPDPNPEHPFVWYEIPGAGAIKRDDWQYFHDQALFVFDAILVLFDGRFSLTDVAILANARRFGIPTYIVRSKADRYVRNIMSDMGYDSNDDKQAAARRNQLHVAARKRFVEETRKCVKLNLENARLPDQHVYIVSNSTLLSIVRNKMPKNTFDEVELLHDLFHQVDTRQVTSSRM